MKQRAPFLKQQEAKRPAPPVAPKNPFVADAAAHPNPYYIPEVTEQDPLAIPKAYGFNVDNIDETQFQKNNPLGTETMDLSNLNTDAMQVKNQEMAGFLDQLSGAITHIPAPGAVPSLEEQILVLQFVGVDPRQIAALQKKLDAQNAKKAEEEKLEHAKEQTKENKTAKQSKPSPMITLNAKELLQESMGVHFSEASRPSFAQSLLDSRGDPFPESISAAQASRTAGGELPEEDEPIFKHDPLQNLPADKSRTLARSSSSNPDIIRTIPGLATTAQIDMLLHSTEVPANFPIQNLMHIQYLRSAIKVAKTERIQINDKKYKSRLSSRTSQPL